MKALVVGADGMIGAALRAALERRGDAVFGTTRRAATITASRPFLDLASPDVDTMPLPDVDIVFFCAAIVSYAECRAHPALARQVNVAAPTRLARRLVKTGARIVLLSTNAVFNGREPNVPAGLAPSPITVYGELAAEAERQFSAFGSAAAIVRLTKLITPDADRFTNWIDALSRGQAVVAFSDLRMAPISFEDTISVLLAVADRSTNGIVQASAAYDISYHQAARHIATQLGAEPALVIQEKAINAGIRPEEIIQFSSLDTARFTELTGRPAPDPYDVLDSVFAQQFAARRA